MYMKSTQEVDRLRMGRRSSRSTGDERDGKPYRKPHQGLQHRVSCAVEIWDVGCMGGVARYGLP